MQSNVRNEQQHAVNFLARLGRTTSETHELLKTAYQQDALRKPATRAYVRRFQTLGVDLYRGSPRSKRSKTRSKKIGGASPTQKVDVSTENKEVKSETFFNTNNEAENICTSKEAEKNCTSNAPNLTSITTKESTENQNEIVAKSFPDIDNENNPSKENYNTTENVSVDKETIEDEDTDIENDDDTYILSDDISNDQGDIYKQYQNEKYNNIDEVNDHILSQIDVFNEAVQSSDRFDSQYKQQEPKITSENVIDNYLSQNESVTTNQTNVHNIETKEKYPECNNDDIVRVDIDLQSKNIQENEDNIEVEENKDLNTPSPIGWITD